MRIPLTVAGPEIEPAETPALAQQNDIYPTLAELAGLKVPEHVQGKGLKRVIADPTAEVHASVYCTKKPGHLLRTKRWAYLAWPDGSSEWYDMTKDPKQFTNLAKITAHRSVLREMRQRLAKKVRAIGVTR